MLTDERDFNHSTIGRIMLACAGLLAVLVIVALYNW